MAGLLIKELIIRGDLERCLVIAPGNLVEQWQDELKDKFDLTFDIVSHEQIETSVTGNPFAERNRLIMRLDMAARSETLQAKLQASPDWDLVVCDEAHRMAASLFGTEVKYTKRYRLGQLAGSRARHFMLMSERFQKGCTPLPRGFCTLRKLAESLRCQPRAMVATHRLGRNAAGLTEAPHPVNDRADAQIEQGRSLPA
jgi:Type III restriction enzyme, res subunit